MRSMIERLFDTIGLAIEDIDFDWLEDVKKKGLEGVSYTWN